MYYAIVLLLMLVLPVVSIAVEWMAGATDLVVLVGGAAVCALAYRLMLRIGRLPTERRILS